MKNYRIRRCHGNRAAWALVALRGDGSEVESFHPNSTSYSVDTLLARHDLRAAQVDLVA